jgi:RHH-type proline utilization regulon transcriptional repressor/proline dehydrogenase/delta 1-pyrroline-5-carboxylate dehydrogenase
MLRGAMRELSVGNPDRLSVDVGPVIDTEARNGIQRHIETLRTAGHRVDQVELNGECRHGTFVAPTIIEIDHISELTREVFGPVLHVVRYKRDELDALLDAINGTGYGLTFGVHTRIDETIAHVTGQVHAGNVYVNRNIVGAVVGVQPFGGECLSGTGPKAGGPLYMYRLLGTRPAGLPPALDAAAPLPQRIVLPGPTGETNTYMVEPRGAVYCVAATEAGARAQWSVARLTGNHAWFADTPAAQALLATLDAEQQGQAGILADDEVDQADYQAVLFEGDGDALQALNQRIAQRPGAILAVHGLTSDALAAGAAYVPERLLTERSISVNTAAAGGNASLMTIG